MSIERVFVAGAGLMGHGIGQVHAAIGRRVTLYEPDLARAEAGRARIAANLDRAVAKGKLDRGGDGTRSSAASRRRRTSRAVADADLVVEAVFEDLRVKQGLWREIDGRAAKGAIFASNTSSISIDELASGRCPQAVGSGSSECTSSAPSRSCRSWS